MKKTTIINHTTSEGKAVIITVTRIQGNEPYRYWDDGYESFGEKYEDRYEVKVEYNGKTYNHCGIHYDSKAPNGRYIGLYGHQALCLPTEKWDEIDNAISEQITEELSPVDKDNIEIAKNALDSGRHMPKAELAKKREEYDKMMNEGCCGYNPFIYYVSTEFVDTIKNKFPEYFKD